MEKYSKLLVEKATKILKERFIYNETLEGWVDEENNSFLPTKDKNIAIAIIAKYLNRRGNKKQIRFKDWLFHNKLNIIMKEHVA